MNDRLIQSQRRLRDSLYELYEVGGLDLMQAGTLGLKRDLIIDLETSALTPEKGEIIHYYAVIRWDTDVFIYEWAKPSVALSPKVKQVLGVTNERLVHYRLTDVLLSGFLNFTDGYSWWVDDFEK